MCFLLRPAFELADDIKDEIERNEAKAKAERKKAHSEVACVIISLKINSVGNGIQYAVFIQVE